MSPWRGKYQLRCTSLLRSKNCIKDSEYNYRFYFLFNCHLHAHNYEGNTDSEEIFKYPMADPYLAEDQAFVSAVTSGDLSTVRCSYSDAASTYCLSWAIASASTTM